MNCPNCGKRQAKSARFCNNCGYSFAAPAQPAAPAAPPPAAAAPAPPQPAVAPGATPPPPRGTLPAVAWASLGVGGVILVGFLVWFFALRSEGPADTPAPESSPVVVTSPTAPPTAPPSPDASPSPTSPIPSPSPTETVPTGATPTNYSVSVCGSVSETNECLEGYEYVADYGWTIPASTEEFHVYFSVENPAEGDTVKFEYYDRGTGQLTGEAVWDPLTGVTPGYWGFWSPWSEETGATWSAGASVSVVVVYNGQPLSFGGPNDIYFE